MKQILVLNGSISGSDGSTEQCLRRVASNLSDRGIDIVFRLLTLRKGLDWFLADVRKSDGFVIGTGTYWDSWGSPLQKFLEDIAGLDSSSLLFGKPVGLVVTEHSTGGKGVLSRLMGVLNTFGLWCPPHGGMVYSAVAHWALGHGWLSGNGQAEETWHLDDLDVIAHNLAEAVLGTHQWTPWPVSGDPDEPFRQRWLNP